MTQDKKTEKVGYKNPPRATRWKPGQSGNPRGKRKRRPESIAELIEKYFAMEIDFTFNGVSSRASIFEVILWQLWGRNMAGDKKAMKVLLNYMDFSSAGRERALIVIKKYSESTKKMAELGTQDEGPTEL